ncbi:Signal transduction response regulator, receiver region domain protein [Candidatus Magnetoovum chiemensis]|nr:Signal transduction response regulator, receiver region domain protein [Candidatus Magnetoovum chiemensis]
MEKAMKTILVVDDDLFIREMLSYVLKDAGFDVINAQDGQEALELCVKQPKDISLIVSDMLMPKMDGLELIDQLGKNNCTVPVILLTGEDDEAIMKTALKTGAKACIIKDDTITDTIAGIVEANI